MDGFVDAIVSIFQEDNIITASEAKAMREDFGNRAKEAFDIFLLSQGLVTKPELLNALSKLYNVPPFDVVGYFFDNELLRNFPKDFLLTNSIVPIQLDQSVLTVVASEPDDTTLRTSISEFCNYAIEFRVGLKRDIHDAIRQYYDASPTKIKDIFEDDQS